MIRPSGPPSRRPPTWEGAEAPSPRIPTVTGDPSTPVPDLVLYGRDGCHLCEESRAILESRLADRQRSGLPAPTLVERDIATDPELERRFFAVIPVVELGERRVELATSAAGLRRLLREVLDEQPAPSGG